MVRCSFASIRPSVAALGYLAERGLVAGDLWKLTAGVASQSESYVFDDDEAPRATTLSFRPRDRSPVACVRRVVRPDSQKAVDIRRVSNDEQYSRLDTRGQRQATAEDW